LERLIPVRFSVSPSSLLTIWLVFTTNLAYVIQRELDLLEHPELNYLALTQNGLFGKLESTLTGLGPGLGKWRSESKRSSTEHIMQIDLDVKTESGLRIVDSFLWDISNPDNVPEEFAAMLVADLVLENQQTPSDQHLELWNLEKLVALEIRRQI